MPVMDGIYKTPAEVRPAEDADAAYVNREHAAGQKSKAAMLQHYLNAGRKLLKKKEGVLGGKKHGGWQKWVEANLDFSRQTTSRYMKFAQLVDEDASANGLLNPDRLAELWASTRHSAEEEPAPDEADEPTPADDEPSPDQADGAANGADEDEDQADGAEDWSEGGEGDEPAPPTPEPTAKSLRQEWRHTSIKYGKLLERQCVAVGREVGRACARAMPLSDALARAGTLAVAVRKLYDLANELAEVVREAKKEADEAKKEADEKRKEADEE